MYKYFLLFLQPTVMKLEFTKEQSVEMYNILIEIRDALKDKSTNTDFKLSVVEIGWFRGIDRFLNKIYAHMRNEELKLIY